MIQPHAGTGYGMHFPLHPGVEVAIIFIDGDPDRPLILGAVPNPVTPSPVQSANAKESRIQTASGIRLRMIDR
jgi:type VI secretion system secreted protein VgrG